MTIKEEAAFGARLRRLRLQRGLSQRDLAEPAYTAAYISTLEAGKRRASRPAIDHFAERLGVEVDELLTGKPPDLEARLDAELAAARVDVSAARLDAADKKLQWVAREAKQYGLVRYRAKALEMLARALEQRGDVGGAIELYESSNALLEEEPPIARTTATVGVARLSHLGGDSHYAIHLLERFLVELAQSGLPDPHSLMIVHATLVVPYFEAGLRDRSAMHAEKALKLLSECSDPFTIATTHVQVARALLETGRIKDAETSLARAEELFITLELQTELSIARLARGYALAHSARLEEAEPFLRAALEKFEELGNKLGAARATNEIARVFRLQGKTEDARPLLTRALDLLEGTDPTELALTHRELGLLDRGDDPNTAEKNLRRAIELFELGEDKVQVAATYAALGDLMKQGGREAEASDAFRAGTHLFVEAGDD